MLLINDIGNVLVAASRKTSAFLVVFRAFPLRLLVMVHEFRPDDPRNILVENAFCSCNA